MDEFNHQTMPSIFDPVHPRDDSPPPYASSAEPSEHGDAEFIVPQGHLQIPPELQAIMLRPIDDDEVQEISSWREPISHPVNFYYSEAIREEDRFDRRHPGHPDPPIFRKLNGRRRIGVIVRHLVKRRWEKLGVWNPEWVFAGRHVRPSDNFRKWTWWWQQPAGAANQELVARTLRLRQNLRRGEYAPVLPRSCPGQGATAAEAEAFLISRPWFIFQIEIAEERQRYCHLSLQDQQRYPYSARNQVIKWWKDRGDWRDEFSRRDWVTAWKWRHESPSPEPEDLAPIDKMKESPLDAKAEMEFTPSEIDELETIELPRSEQPEGFWTSDEEEPPYFPGMMSDVEALIEKSLKERAAELEKLKAEGWKPPPDPILESWKKKFGNVDLFGRPLPPEEGEEEPPEEGEDAPPEEAELAPPEEAEEAPPEEAEEAPPEEHEASRDLQVDTSQPQRDAACPLPHTRRRLRQRQPRDGVDGAQDQDQLPPPTLRRSARIAGRKRPQPKEKTETEPRRGPGRPRKENGPNIHSTVRKKSARAPGLARARNGSTRETDVLDMPRRRGRPRKNT